MKLLTLFLSFVLPLIARAAEPISTAPAKRGFTLEDLKAQVPVSKEGHFQMEVPSILNTITDPEVQVLLAGQSVETTGQITVETVDNAAGKRLRISRSQLQCCSTHARQTSVALEFSEKAPAFKELAWVKLVGTMIYRPEGLRRVPVLIVKEFKEIAAPQSPVLQ